MQPEVAGGETMSFPSTTSARIEDAPEVQAVGRLFAPVACAELSVSTATSASRRQALTRSRWPQYRTARAWREITRTAWAARLIFSSAEAYFCGMPLSSRRRCRSNVWSAGDRVGGLSYGLKMFSICWNTFTFPWFGARAIVVPVALLRSLHVL